MNYLQYYCNKSNDIKLEKYISKESVNVFHYTSPLGFKSIIENKQLRFSDRLYLNDKSEGNYVIDLLKNNSDKLSLNDDGFIKALENKINELPVIEKFNNFYVYQCSFSLDSDSLPLWNYYSKDNGIKGYNLMFNTNDLSDNLNPKSKDNMDKPKLLQGRVIYDEAKQLTIINSLIQYFYDAYKETMENKEEYNTPSENACLNVICGLLVDKLKVIGTFFKSSYFKFESEYRFAYDLYVEDGKYSVIGNEQNFFEKSGYMIPCVDIGFDPQILKQITISPTIDFPVAQKSVKRFLQNGFSHIAEENIKQSNIPVRY